jgi:hypothetical protein
VTLRRIFFIGLVASILDMILHVWKLKICKVQMLYYKDHIPDLEQCNIHGEDDMVDATTLNIRNDYATKILLLVYPFQENHDFPLFEDRWKFFCEAYERGSLYWDSTKIMQNIQDVENSRKIVSKKESSEVLSGVDLEFDVEQDTYCEIDVNDDENHEMSLKTFDNQVRDDDLDVIFEEFGIQDYNDGLTNFQLGENVCGNLTRKMKEQHIIHDPVSSEESALIQKTSTFSEKSYNFVESDHQQAVNNDSTDVVKVILQLGLKHGKS